ncbi:hypothetical protein PRIPAC_83117 [Pristionchus pacificus]|uniref:Transmembrane ion channel n=1 Tax=Pristionchus pacificus TaxID=54126 RepID=A0A2A6BUZ6_PRIPA|nr:hypothetical protein PRIPAC_83117 [Pristionchus pacificus]|eukprot:PDM69581.1 transmembrane ion channel [Pristionchus pacificus]
MLKFGPVILVTVAVDSASFTPTQFILQSSSSPETVLLRYFEKDGFRVQGSVHVLKLESVDEHLDQVQTTVSSSYTFIDPHLRWDPSRMLNIEELEVDRAMLWGPRIYRCGSSKTLRFWEADVRRRSILDSKPNDRHDCTIRLCVSGITGLDLPIREDLAVEGNDEWTICSTRSAQEVGMSMEAGGITRFGGATTPKSGQVEIMYTIRRYHIYNGWTLWDLAAVSVLLTTIVHRITGKKILSLLARVVFILVVNNVAAGHFFSRREAVTHLAWSLLYLFLLLLATVAIAVTVAQERKQNNMTEEAKRLAEI